MHIIDYILHMSDLTIDSRIAFKIPPNKLMVDSGIHKHLETLCKRRSALWNGLSGMDHIYESCNSTFINKCGNTTLMICLHGSHVCMEIHSTHNQPRSFKTHSQVIQVIDMHTGMVVR